MAYVNMVKNLISVPIQQTQDVETTQQTRDVETSQQTRYIDPMLG